MKYEPNNRFFCLPIDINIDDYGEILDWGYENPQANTVLPLTNAELDYYQEIGLWYMIAEQTGYYLLGPGENDSIHDMEIIEKVYNAFLQSDMPKDENINKMVEILHYAVLNDRDIFIQI